MCPSGTAAQTCPLHGRRCTRQGRAAAPLLPKCPSPGALRAPRRALCGVDDVQRLHVAQVLQDERAVQVRHVLVLRMLAHARAHLDSVKSARRAPPA